MKTNATFVLKTMHVVFWVLFIGLCIETGTVLISFLVSEFINPGVTERLYLGRDLLALKRSSGLHYVGIVSFSVYFLAVKAYLAYLVILIFQKLDFAAPFSSEIAALITRISHVALGAGVVALAANGYAKWAYDSGEVGIPRWSGGEFLFLAGIIFIIAQVFQRGTDIQSENALTV